MTARVVGAFLLALAIAARLIWTDGGDRPEPRPSTPAPTAADRKADRPPETDSERLKDDSDARGVDAPPAGRTAEVPGWLAGIPIDSETVEVAGYPVRGRVAWQETGLPVEGATVSLTRRRLTTAIALDEPRGKKEFDPATEAKTDRFGNFTLPDVPAREDLWIRFDFDGAVDIHKLRRLPEPGDEVWQGEFLLERRGTVVGRVFKKDGTPIGRASVRAIDDPMFDGAIGPELRDRRVAGAETFDSEGLESVPNKAGSRRRVSAATRYRDRILPFPQTTTDENGRFTLRGVRQGEARLAVRAEKLAGAASDVLVLADQVVDVGAIVLEPGVEVAIKVVDEELEPVPNLSVAAGFASWRFWGKPQTTDKRGVARFLVPPLPKQEPPSFASIPVSMDEFSLRKLHQRYSRVRRNWENHQRRMRLIEVRAQRMRLEPWERLGYCTSSGTATLTLPARQGVEVIVTSADGRPLDEASFRTMPPTRFTSQPVGGGRHRLVGINPNAASKLVVMAPDHAPGVLRLGADESFGSLPPPIRAGATLSANLLPTFDITFEIIDREHQPVPDARIELAFVAERRWRRGVVTTNWSQLGRLPVGYTDEAGRLHVEGVWDNEITVHVKAQGYADLTQKVTPVSQGVSTLTVDHAAHVRGVIVDGLRAAERRYAVRALHRPWDPRDPVFPTAVATSTIDGRFALPSLRPARWELQVTDPDAPITDGRQKRHPRALARQTVILEAGADLHVDVQLDAGDKQNGSDGTVLIAGKPRERLRIQLLRSQYVGTAEFPRTAWTDADGHFSFPGLSLQYGDTLTVEVQENGRWRRLRTDLLRGGPSGRAVEDPPKIDIKVGSAVVGLFDDRDAPMAGRLVEMKGPYPTPIQTVTDSSGTIRADLLFPGTYSVRLAGPSNLQFHVPVRITAGETAYADLEATRTN